MDHERDRKTLHPPERRLTELARFAPIGVYITDASGDEVLVNNRWCQITGLPEADSRGGKWMQAVHPEDREMVRRAIDAGRDTRSEYLLKCRLVRDNGRIIWIAARAAPVVDPECDFRGYVGVIMDIGLPESDMGCEGSFGSTGHDSPRHPETWIAKLGHELRTPLQGIVGLADLLDDEQDATNQGEYAEGIRSSALRLVRTVDHLLHYLVMPEHEEPPLLREVDLHQAFDDVAAQFRPSAQANGTRIALDPECRDLTGLADEALLKQALGHILDNAIRFAPGGTVTLRVRMVVARGVEFAELVVTDTGIGIPSEFQKTVFEPFRQVSEGPSRKYEGAGLGLTLAKRIMRAMGGEIRLYSEPGRGTEVVLRLARSTRPK